MSAGAVQSGRRGRDEVDGPGRFTVGSFVVEDGLLVLTGRWTGVRGMRFVRPTLVLPDRDVLATLTHKPWAVVDGDDWTVAFPWSERTPPPLDTAQLAVAPNITVPLGAAVAPPARPPVAERAARLEREVDFLRGRRTEELGVARERLGAAEDARDALRERLALAESRVAELGQRTGELTAAHRDAERRAADAEARLAALDDRAGAEVTALRRRAASLEDRLAAAEQRAADLQQQLDRPAVAPAPDARDDAPAVSEAAPPLSDELAAAQRRALAAEELAGELSQRLAAAERRADALSAQAKAPDPAPALLRRRPAAVIAEDVDEAPIGVRAAPLPEPPPVRRELLPGIDLWAQRILASAAALSLVLLLLGIVRLL